MVDAAVDAGTVAEGAGVSDRTFAILLILWIIVSFFAVGLGVQEGIKAAGWLPTDSCVAYYEANPDGFCETALMIIAPIIGMVFTMLLFILPVFGFLKWYGREARQAR